MTLYKIETMSNGEPISELITATDYAQAVRCALSVNVMVLVNILPTDDIENLLDAVGIKVKRAD